MGELRVGPHGYSHGWIKAANWQDSVDYGTGRKSSILGQPGDFHGHVQEGGGKFSWRVNRQRTPQEGPDASGSWWTGNHATGIEPDFTKAKSAAVKAMKEHRQKHLDAGGSVGFSESRTAETPVASTVHEPVGKPGGPGLWHHGWQLPAYIQHVANRLRAQGHGESNAVQMAVGIVKNWAEGHDGRGNRVSADVQAAAVKAVAEWEALKGAAHASSSGRSAPVAHDIEFRVGPHGWSHGWIYEGAAGMAAEDKADHMSKKLAGHSFPGGDDSAEALDAHRAAAKAHREAARLSSSPSVVQHHTERARLHSAVAGGRMYARDAHKKMGLRSMTPLGVEFRAPLTSASINDLPDSAFAYIEPGGTKDSSGKTAPRSLRHFPVHDAAHVRNALARAPQSPFGDKAMPKIKAAAAKLGVTVGGDSDGDEGTRSMPDRAERRVTPSVMEIRMAPDGAPHIGGYGAVFGKLSRNLGGFVEKVGDTAFNQSRQLGWPSVRCRLNHDKNQLLGTTEGRTLQLRVDNIGLDYEVEPPPSMRHVVEWVQRGDISTSSFAFNCPPGGDEWRTSDQGYPLRILHEVQLLDVAPVTEGEAYADATLGLRSLAAAMDAPFEEVRALAAEDELRRFFVRTDRPSRPKPPPVTGPAAMMALMEKRRSRWADQDV